MTDERPRDTMQTVLDSIYTLLCIGAVGMTIWIMCKPLGWDLRIKAYLANLRQQAKEDATARRLVREALGE